MLVCLYWNNFIILQNVFFVTENPISGMFSQKDPSREIHDIINCYIGLSFINRPVWRKRSSLVRSISLPTDYLFIYWVVYLMTLSVVIAQSVWQQGMWLEWRVSIPGRGKISLFFIVSKPVLRLTQPPTQWVLLVLSPGVKRPGCEADQLPLSSDEVKNGGAIYPLPHVFMPWCIINLTQGNFTFVSNLYRVEKWLDERKCKWVWPNVRGYPAFAWRNWEIHEKPQSQTTPLSLNSSWTTLEYGSGALYLCQHVRLIQVSVTSK
jgi:hypothetical protein